MLFIITIFIALVLALCVWAVGRYWEPLVAVGCFQNEQRLLAWAAKGIAVPLLLWLGFNFALTPGAVATIPRLSLASASAADWTRIALEWFKAKGDSAAEQVFWKTPLMMPPTWKSGVVWLKSRHARNAGPGSRSPVGCTASSTSRSR